MEIPRKKIFFGFLSASGRLCTTTSIEGTWFFERVKNEGHTMGNSLVLLPTYNERENLTEVLPRLSSLELEVDVLVIDDASPDGTGALAEELGKKYCRLSVLHRRKKEGLGPAYLHGFREALKGCYGRIVTMDADLSHSPEDVPRLLRALEEADIAIGSRHVPGGGVEGWPLSRQILSRAGSLYARTLLRLPLSDVTSGFRAYRVSALRELNLELLHSKGFVFQVEILRRILDLPGAKALEVPIVFKNRAHGHSKISRKIINEAVFEVGGLLLRRRHLPQRRYEPLEEDSGIEPAVTVIVPTPPEAPAPKALEGLKALSYPREKVEVILSRGRSPSRQRNEAVRESHGDYLLFLDDDSLPEPDLLPVYLRAFKRDPTLGAVGGPAEALPGNFIQGLSALVLGEPWVLGKTASRYRARGRARFTDERELILCNLCVKRKAFEEAGGFREGLYPNEENEFLERLRLRGWRLLYRPDARVKRPQRESLGALLRAVFGYGSGRSAQARALLSSTSLKRLAWIFLALALGALSFAGVYMGSLLLAFPLVLYGAYLVLLSIRLSFRSGLKTGILGALLSALIHGSYSLGVVFGIFSSCLRKKSSSAVAIERMDS
jgi:dolichol-phosphate mannosyltransferase